MAGPLPIFQLRMPCFHFLLVFVCVCFLLPTPAQAMFDWLPPGQVCDARHNYQPEPYTGPAPPLPKLPKQYTMTVSANILQKNWNSEVIEYYDAPNKRATVFLTFNGTTTQTIFNLRKMEKYDIYPNNTCRTRPGTVDFYGFISMDRNNRPVMSTVNEMFRMGSKFNMTYVGPAWVRGIRVNHWTSCQEWQQIGSKFQLDYYFTHPDYQGAWGQGQVPVRAVVNGSAGNVNMSHGHMKGSHRFEHIYDFSMKVGPIEDREVFYIPTEVVCTGRTVHKKMPDLPDNFQMDMEVSCPVMGSNIPMQQSLRYDWDHRLVETWRAFPNPQGRPEDHHNKLMEGQATLQDIMDVKNMVMRHISMVDDYSTGLRYLTEKSNNTCKVVRLPANEDETTMSHGNTLLNIQRGQNAGMSPFTYQGRSMYRDLPVEVWGVESGGMIQKLLFLANRVPDMGNPKPDKPKSMSKRSVADNRPTGKNNNSTTQRPTHNWVNWQRGNNADGNDKGQQNQGGKGKGQQKQGGKGKGQQNQGGKGKGQQNQGWKGNGQQNQGGKGQQGQQSPGLPSIISKSMAAMSKMRQPFPVLVGMVFRNYTAINTRNMPKLFREIITSEVIQWAAKNANTQQQSAPKKDSDADLDKILSMERIHNKMMRHMGEMDVNVFHFQPLHTDESMFQVSQCYSPEQTSQVMLHIHTPFQESVRHNRDAFSIAMRKGVAEAMGVSYVQISSLNPVPLVDKKKNIDRTSVTFTLLGTPPIEGYRKKQPSIDKAKERLVQAINNGITFKVKYATHTKSFLVDKTLYSIDHTVKTPQGMSQDSAFGSARQQGKDHDGDSDSNYSSGSVAGIAIATLALGVVGATIVVAFLYKRKHPEEPVVPYKISKA